MQSSTRYHTSEICERICIWNETRDKQFTSSQLTSQDVIWITEDSKWQRCPNLEFKLNLASTWVLNALINILLSTESSYSGEPLFIFFLKTFWQIVTTTRFYILPQVVLHHSNIDLESQLRHQSSSGPSSVAGSSTGSGKRFHSSSASSSVSNRVTADPDESEALAKAKSQLTKQSAEILSLKNQVNFSLTWQLIQHFYSFLKQNSFCFKYFWFLHLVGVEINSTNIIENIQSQQRIKTKIMYFSSKHWPPGLKQIDREIKWIGPKNNTLVITT